MIFTISFCEGLNELISRYLLAVSSRWLKTAAMARPTKNRLVVCEGSSPESTMVVVLVLRSYPEKPRLRDCELPYQYIYRGRRTALHEANNTQKKKKKKKQTKTKFMPFDSPVQLNPGLAFAFCSR